MSKAWAGAQIAMSPTQVGRFLALGETIVRIHSTFSSPFDIPAYRCLLLSFGYCLLSCRGFPHLGYWVTADIAHPPKRFVERTTIHTSTHNPRPTPIARHFASYWTFLRLCDPVRVICICARYVYAALHPHPSLLSSSPPPRSAGLG